jgi:hypothetical protein
MEDRPVHRSVARVDMRQAGMQVDMRPWQGMKGNRRIEMMLSIVGHVPHQKTHWPRCQGGACVGEAIGILTAAGILGEQSQRLPAKAGSLSLTSGETC